MHLGIDIIEDDILALNEGILQTLLLDHTTGHNIIWATNDYVSRGHGYGFNDYIEIAFITGENNHVIMPRIAKDSDEQRNRSRSMAEVFTPSWVCNAQNNLIDNAWFGQPNVFNLENEDGAWTSNPNPMLPENKKWQDYVKDTRLEMACGEAPYIVSRYDATTGKPIKIGNRIGLLDRKLWLIHNNTPNAEKGTPHKQRKTIHKKWMRQVYKAFQSVYGFEWQGDNLLLAREALFVTFIEYYQAKWHTSRLPNIGSMRKIAQIISWNIWQMDGLKFGIPGQTPTESLGNNLFHEEVPPQLRYCRIKEWTGIEPLKGKEIIYKAMLDN